MPSLFIAMVKILFLMAALQKHIANIPNYLLLLRIVS